MHRMSKLAGKVAILFLITLLASCFANTDPPAYANADGSQIGFGVAGDTFSYLSISGTNQNGDDVTWYQSYPYPKTLDVTSNWWWLETINIEVYTTNHGWRQCIIDNLQTTDATTWVTYTPGRGCNGDTGSAVDTGRWITEFSNYMDSYSGSQLVEAASGVNDVVDCFQGIADGLESGNPVIVVAECYGIVLSEANQALGTINRTLELGNNASPSHSWLVHLYNMDDYGAAYLNGARVAEASYEDDSGWIDITSAMSSGDNSLGFYDWNDTGGYTWGFQVAYDGNIVWSDQAGQCGYWGANNDDTSLPQQWVHSAYLTLHSDGTVN